MLTRLRYRSITNALVKGASLSPIEQDEHIRFLVEREIAHSRMLIDTQRALPQPDPMSRWCPLLLGGVVTATVLLTILAIFVAIVY